LTNTLPSLTESLQSALSSLPSSDAILPPSGGITLLDSKNEIFLSYLQALALRNLEVIRSVREHLPKKEGSKNSAGDEDVTIRDGLVKDLVKHRVYLEKGVRPLEDRLKYQIDKVVRAADDEERTAKAREASAAQRNGHTKSNEAEDSDSDASKSDADSVASADASVYRPNPNAFGRQNQSSATSAPSDTTRQTSTSDVYRPPRIQATTMPTTERRPEKRDGRPTKSATIDEYISTELSTAPAAEPSIGSTIVSGGRRTKSAKERADEQERREYEETNLVRLPKESKKEMLRKQGGRGAGAGYGGEEWRGLGGDVDRIDRLTSRKSGGGGGGSGGVGGALEKSRKRARETVDGPRGDGVAAGGEFEKRRKKVMRKLK